MLRVIFAFVLVLSLLPMQYLNAAEEDRSFFGFEITDSSSENPAFRNVKVIGGKGSYVITGETRPVNREYFYTVDDGHKELISVKKENTKLNFPNWSPFRIEVNIPREKLPQNGTLILNLFERSHDGKVINTFPVILVQ
ncbi:intracellular proteinase inhibitor [Bacillus sp. FJAT-29790]|uniref:intracellular proteinase inhibitor n=1 Tax=Bacillus sp. FJAT-29790 TaxID=1895002 RepID=UPI001C217406|nr:intracellular proteinase inhibitor [Bacillus sp. FJAT-29790]MBU8877430.1 intracellular proteinase inhibitor [Bacillus sp. FJAT-29790]